MAHPLNITRTGPDEYSTELGGDHYTVHVEQPDGGDQWIIADAHGMEVYRADTLDEAFEAIVDTHAEIGAG
jgi:hypothetical protein